MNKLYELISMIIVIAMAFVLLTGCGSDQPGLKDFYSMCPLTTNVYSIDSHGQPVCAPKP